MARLRRAVVTTPGQCRTVPYTVALGTVALWHRDTSLPPWMDCTNSVVGIPATERVMINCLQGALTLTIKIYSARATY